MPETRRGCHSWSKAAVNLSERQSNVWSRRTAPSDQSRPLKCGGLDSAKDYRRLDHW
jgi:hypothetical protein